MPRYMYQFSYTPEAWAALLRNPTDRTESVRRLAEGVGGKLIDFYYAFGEYDGVVIFETPDNASQAGAVLSAFAAGHIKASKTTVLLTVPEAVEAMRKGSQASITPPS
jgi:uncharacterized protein with GYD domain